MSDCIGVLSSVHRYFHSRNNHKKCYRLISTLGSEYWCRWPSTFTLGFISQVLGFFKFLNGIQNLNPRACSLSSQSPPSTDPLSKSLKEIQACMFNSRVHGLDYTFLRVHMLWYYMFTPDQMVFLMLKWLVVHRISDESFDCSCNHFIQNGLLCRHILKVMLEKKFKVIPTKYILCWWCRELVPVEILPARAWYGEMDVEKQGMMNKAISIFDRIVGIAWNDKDVLGKFVDQLEELYEEISMDIPLVSSSKCKESTIEELIGVSQPESVEVLLPSGLRNKGCGTRKGLVSASERVAKKEKKAKTLCRRCHAMASHDSRNCPDKDSGIYQSDLRHTSLDFHLSEMVVDSNLICPWRLL